jgi:hypothetical protein
MRGGFATVISPSKRQGGIHLKRVLTRGLRGPLSYVQVLDVGIQQETRLWSFTRLRCGGQELGVTDRSFVMVVASPQQVCIDRQEVKCQITMTESAKQWRHVGAVAGG